MGHQRLGSYLRTHRRRSGLSQRALASVLGLKNEGQISRYERMQVMPTLVVALGYETLFRIPVSELFAGAHQTIRLDIEENLRKLETELQHSTGKGPRAAATARVLEWLEERRVYMA